MTERVPNFPPRPKLFPQTPEGQVNKLITSSLYLKVKYGTDRAMLDAILRAVTLGDLGEAKALMGAMQADHQERAVYEGRVKDALASLIDMKP